MEAGVEAAAEDTVSVPCCCCNNDHKDKTDMLSQAEEQVLGTYRPEIKVWVELVPSEDSLHVSMTSFQLLLGLGLCDLWPLLKTDL